jgi:hypothetical protein
MATPPKPTPRQLTTPRAAALAGVLFALLFGAVLILIRTKMPEGATGSSEWLNSRGSGIVTAAKLMPFAGIAFDTIREHGKTIEAAITETPDFLAPLRLHYLRWLLFDIGDGLTFQ